MSEVLPNTKLREMTHDEIELHAAEVLRELFDLRVKRSTDALDKPHSLRGKRREYARILTLLGERKSKGKKA